MSNKKDCIKLSPKHGLNPSIMQCPVCHKDMGIALLGEIENDREAPKYILGELCNTCKSLYATVYEMDCGTVPTGKAVYVKKEVLSEQYREHDHLLMTTTEFQKLFNLTTSNNENN